MFGIGETELVIIVVFAFLLFGPDKLPGMGRTLGRVLRQFREASDGFTEVVQTNIMDPASEELEKSPKQRKREQEELAGNDASGSDAAAQDAPTPKRETFAERKARLMAERKAAEEAAAAKAASDQEPAHSDDAAVHAAESVSAPSTEDLKAAEQIPSKPAHPSAADLYAHTGQKSSRFHKKSDDGDASEGEASKSSAHNADAAKQGKEAGEA